jgi:hypothetical protein
MLKAKKESVRKSEIGVEKKRQKSGHKNRRKIQNPAGYLFVIRCGKNVQNLESEKGLQRSQNVTRFA